jgi:hypothetical protein
VRDYVGDPFASITWAIRSRVLLKASRELDCPILTLSFYKIFEYPTIFNRVARYMMVGAEFAFARLIYVCGSLAKRECQSAFHGLLEYSSCFAL